MTAPPPLTAGALPPHHLHAPGRAGWRVGQSLRMGTGFWGISQALDRLVREQPQSVLALPGIEPAQLCS